MLELEQLHKANVTLTSALGGAAAPDAAEQDAARAALATLRAG